MPRAATPCCKSRTCRSPGRLGPDVRIGRTFNSQAGQNLNDDVAGCGYKWELSVPKMRYHWDGNDHFYGPDGEAVRFKRNGSSYQYNQANQMCFSVTAALSTVPGCDAPPAGCDAIRV